MSDAGNGWKLTRVLGVIGMVFGLAGGIASAAVFLGPGRDIAALTGREERDVARLTGQVDRIVIVLDTMRTVDTDLAAGIASKGSDIQLINQRIGQVIDMLIELKTDRVGRQ